MAHTFGASGMVDFVILAQIVPMLFVGLISSGAVLSIPAIARRSADGQVEDGIAVARAYVQRLLRYEAMALAVGVVVADPALAPFAPGGLSAWVFILVLLSMQAWCDSASALYGQLLQVDGHFVRAALQMGLNGALSTAIVLLAGPAIGIWAWPMGMALDSAWQAAFLWISLGRVSRKVSAPTISRRDLLFSFGPSIALFALTLVYGLSDRAAGLVAGAGTLALWTWALRMGNTASGILSMPIATVVFSRGHAHGRRESQLYGAALGISLLLSVAAFVGYQLVGPGVVRFLFGGRKLSPEAVHHLIDLTRLAVLAAIPLASFTVTSRACAGRGAFRSSIASFAGGAVLYPLVIVIVFGHLGYLSLGVAYVLASSVTAGLSYAATVRRGWLAIPRLSALRGTA